MARRIQLRRDVATNWEFIDPVLAQGEVGVDLTNNKFKIGNGVDGWNELDYFSGDADLTSVTRAILPQDDGEIDLGSLEKQWDNIFVKSQVFLGGFPVSTGEDGSLLVGAPDGSTLKRIATEEFVENYAPTVTPEGKTYYVTSNGSDSNTGLTPGQGLATIKHALSLAVAGDIVRISSGTYLEEFPLTVPAGVELAGAGIRTTTVAAAPNYINNNAFLLSGESSVCDLTVTGFYYNSVTDVGYAFSYAPGAKITARSPYINRVTVLSRGGDTSPEDPFGFDSIIRKAGAGFKFDGSLLDPTSIEPGALANEVTFIVPNSVGVKLVNGTRLELLNAFIYFADKAIVAESGTVGNYGQGVTKLKIENIIGSPAVGNDIIYKDSLGNQLARGTIARIENNQYFFINGKSLGFETAISRPGKPVIVIGDTVISNLETRFGSGAVRLTGNGYFEVINQNDLEIGIGEYTIELFFRRDREGVVEYLFDGRTGSADSQGLHLSINENNNLVLGFGTETFVTGTTFIPSDTWIHVAVNRGGFAGTTLLVNGNSDGSVVESGFYDTKNLRFGAKFDSSDLFVGYLDEIRVSKSVRYGVFGEVPTAPFEPDNSTVLLLHCDGFSGSTTITDDGIGTQDITFESQSSVVTATAKQISLADYRQFGAEMRSIGTAIVYGNQGVVANGVGIDLKLIAFNLAFIGSGKDFSNDPTLAIQSNEIIRSNGAEVYYQTIDHLGDFRVGDSFRINQRTGNVEFGTAKVNLENVSSVTIFDGQNTARLEATNFRVGSLLLSGREVSTTSGNLTVTSASKEVIVDGDLVVTGNLVDENGDPLLPGNDLYRQALPPSSLLGSEGDKANSYAIDEDYFYFCKQDYQSPVDANIVQIDEVVNSVNLKVLAEGLDVVPEAGWVATTDIEGSSITRVIVEISDITFDESAGAEVVFVEFDLPVTTPAETVWLVEGPQPEIWSRVPFGEFASEQYVDDAVNGLEIPTDISNLTDTQNLLGGTTGTSTELPYLELTNKAFGEPVEFNNTGLDGGVDEISEGLHITRGEYGWLYNPLVEEESGEDTPTNSLWNNDGWDDLSDVANREYVSLASIWQNNFRNIVGAEMVMLDTTTDKYYAVKITRWSRDSEGFSYVRYELNLDQLQEGVKFADGTVQKTAYVATNVKLTAEGNRRIEEVAGYKSVSVTSRTVDQEFTGVTLAPNLGVPWDVFIDGTVYTELYAYVSEFQYEQMILLINGVEYTVQPYINGNNIILYAFDPNSGGVPVSYSEGDAFTVTKYTGGEPVVWWDKRELPGGSRNFRGAVIDYHAYAGNGTIIGTIHIVDDSGENHITHTEVTSGSSYSLEADDLWVVDDEGTISYRRLDGQERTLRIQWTAKVFYGEEYYD